MLWRQCVELRLDLEEEHEPVRLSCVAMLTYQPSQVQVARLQRQAQLLLSLSAGAGIRRLACGRVEFSAARAPEALVRLLGAVQQQHFILLIEAVKQSGDLI